jgi:predicted nucleotidyltransferase component of viral defense system
MFVDRLATYLESMDRSRFEKQYLINCIKEYLQFYVLEFIYNDPVYKELIFTGGTALQKCFGLDRMSEDIDLDSPHLIDHDLFANGITGYFKNRFDYNDLYVSVKGKQKKIYLKFPVLTKLELAGPDESELAYVKVEIAPLISENYSTRISVISSHNVNVLVRHYDMPDLFAGKLHAVLTRTYFNEETWGSHLKS